MPNKLTKITTGRENMVLFVMLSLLNGECCNTIVEHPVGYHIDVFGDQLSLECKKCFNLRPSEYVGRAGVGTGRYAFALLD